LSLDTGATPQWSRELWPALSARISARISKRGKSQTSVETPQSEEDSRCTKAGASRSSLDGRVSKGLPLLRFAVEKSISSDEAAEKVVRMVEFCLSFADSGLGFSESARRWDPRVQAIGWRALSYEIGALWICVDPS
jgi:hypothetical protein